MLSFQVSHLFSRQVNRGSEGQEMHTISLHKFLQHFSGQNHVTWSSIAARESGGVIVFYWVCHYPELSWSAIHKEDGENDKMGQAAVSVSLVMDSVSGGRLMLCVQILTITWTVMCCLNRLSPKYSPV